MGLKPLWNLSYGFELRGFGNEHGYIFLEFTQLSQFETCKIVIVIELLQKFFIHPYKCLLYEFQLSPFYSIFLAQTITNLNFCDFEKKYLFYESY